MRRFETTYKLFRGCHYGSPFFLRRQPSKVKIEERIRNKRNERNKRKSSETGWKISVCSVHSFCSVISFLSELLLRGLPQNVYIENPWRAEGDRVPHSPGQRRNPSKPYQGAARRRRTLLS